MQIHQLLDSLNIKKKKKNNCTQHQLDSNLHQNIYLVYFHIWSDQGKGCIEFISFLSPEICHLTFIWGWWPEQSGGAAAAWCFIICCLWRTQLWSSTGHSVVTSAKPPGDKNLSLIDTVAFASKTPGSNKFKEGINFQMSWGNWVEGLGLT